ncbi:MAG: extracellular solute-binding protein [Granulosicoccus sp.]
MSFLDFFEQFEIETERALSLKRGYSETRMLVVLMRNHLEGKLTTSSSLAGHSNLSYGTAMRAIAALQKRGLIVKRPRTSSGKTFSLHPSTQLMEEWQELARRAKSLLGSHGVQARSDVSDEHYFFGASYASENVLTPPSIFESKLHLSGGLRILFHADPTFMAMHILKKRFESMFGVQIKSHAFSIDRLREEILRNAKLPKSRYDIVACDLPWFGEMAQAGHLMSIDKLVDSSSLDLTDFHSEALASTRFNDQHHGLPVQTTPELLVYRRDVFEANDLGPPTTVEETIDAARRIHNPFVGGMAGIAWNAARGTPLGHTFLFVMGAFGQPVLNLLRTADGFDGEHISGEQFRPMFNTAEARASAEYLLELLEYSPRDILTMSWYERARCYAEGHAAIAYCATLLAPLFELDSSSPAYSKTGYLPHPRGPAARSIAPIGGYALAIPANIEPNRVHPAWSALTSLTSARAAKMYIENGSLVSPRFSVSRDPEIRRISPVISIVDDMARNGTVQMWPRPPVPEIADIIAIAGNEMHDMLLGAKSIDQALVCSQNRADELMRANGHY